MYMVTYSAKATASASVVAQFFFRKEETVTATASATAESNVSEEDAYNIALQIAQDVANSAAQNDANVLIQSVNTSTLGDNILFLSSSLLKDFVEKVEEGVYNLVKDLNIPRLLKLIIGPKEALKINKGLTANINVDILGKITIDGGLLTLGGAPEGSTKDYHTTQFSIVSKNMKSSTPTDLSGNNYGNIQITNGGECFVVQNATLNNYGAIDISGNQSTLQINGTLNNNINTSDNITFIGKISSNKNGTLQNGSTNNPVGTINNYSYITINDNSYLNNYGKFGEPTGTGNIYNYSDISFNDNSYLYNYGNLYNYGGSIYLSGNNELVDASANFQNYSYIFLENYSGKISTLDLKSGTFNSIWTSNNPDYLPEIEQNGNFYIREGANFNNTTNISNGGFYDSSGNLYGNLYNYGNFVSSGAFYNYTNFFNYGSCINKTIAGSLTDNGMIQNTGNFIIDPSGTLLNNVYCSLTNYNGSNINANITNNGLITNYGQINNQGNYYTDVSAGIYNNSNFYNLDLSSNINTSIQFYNNTNGNLYINIDKSVTIDSSGKIVYDYKDQLGTMYNPLTTTNPVLLNNGTIYTNNPPPTS